MSEDTTLNLQQSTTLITQATQFLTSQKGLYLGVAVVLAIAIYFYYTKFMKNTSKEESDEKTKEESKEPEKQAQEYEPPPGYVAVPEDVLEQLQYQAQMAQQYAGVPQNQYEQNDQNDQNEENQEEYLEEEDDNIQEQNLTNQEKQSVRQQMSSINQ